MNLKGLNPDLIALCRHALKISAVDFAIIDGLRTVTEQKNLFANGKTQTMNSRHLSGKAVDVMAYDGKVATWEVAYYKQIAEAFQTASSELNIPIVWGGSWTTLKDYGHFELDRQAYP